MSEDNETNEGEPQPGGVTDSIRKAVFGGLSSIFMSEESLRGQLGELPRDALNYLTNQTEKTRQEFYGIVTREFRTFLEGLDLSREIPKIPKGMTVEVNASIRISDAGVPDIDIKTNLAKPDDSDPGQATQPSVSKADTTSETES